MIIVINGPNLNLLGHRQPEIYGKRTLNDIAKDVQAALPDTEFEWFQSNHEGAIIDHIQEALNYLLPPQGIIINAGGLAHTSVALRDAIAAVAPFIPVIEVHISNIYAREEFRHTSLLSPVCCGSISGLGTDCYRLAALHIVSSQ